MVERKPVLSLSKARERRWLKQCKCGKRYWGNNSIKECGQCEPKIPVVSEAEPYECEPVLDKRNTCQGLEVKACECGCEKTFERRENINADYAKKYFNRACQMRAKRRTEAGKAYVEQYNKRYKRIEVEWVCQYPMCGKMVISAYKRVFCDEHSGKPVNYAKRMKKKRPEILASYNYTDSLRRKIKRGIIKTPPCSVCGIDEKIEFHHPNYQEPKNVVALCSKCHKQEHKGKRNIGPVMGIRRVEN